MKKVLIIILVIVTIIVVYNEYPRSGSFNELILSKYSGEQFNEIEITKGDTRKICKDIDKIDEFLEHLGQFQLVEYKKTVPCEMDDIYWISIYGNNNIIGTTIENRKFIYIYARDARKSGNYKIINDSLNIKYIEDFYLDLF
ncbi:hypothetical protein OW763_13705 [Clostridium aestuarii]|uniref:Lipoprotein n=1 Tax=Clostridium aestuarii TaxID=338193 RepID=A0ABT4D2B5_9CLOT|nr:hypothetical protein [Clostridium aestuarii]MCY6485387.1 hypothetical protein [Clostridium aestuarii]